MKLSAKGEYAILALLELALNEGHGPLQVKTIARTHDIPARFLEQVMSVLKQAGLVESIRGAQGGYLIARAASGIRLGDVLQAIEGNLASVETEARTHRQELIGELWTEIEVSFKSILNSINFEELCERKRKKDQQRALMYHI